MIDATFFVLEPLEVRMGGKKPRHDELILRLLKEGRIIVKEDYDDVVEVYGELKPKTKIHVTDARSRDGRLREKTMHPNIVGHPYFSIYPDGRNGGLVWLSARRVVWYSFNPVRTGLMVCPIDRDPWNFNIWNLCLRDQTEENWIKAQNQTRPEEYDDEAQPPNSKAGWLDDIPF